MKAYKKYLFIIPALLLLAGCGEDFLTIPNPNKLQNNNFFETKSHADQALVACYDILHSNGFVNGTNFQYPMHGADPHVLVERPDMESFIYDASSSFISGVYMYLYRGLYRCNTLISRVDEVEDPDFTAELRDVYYAEALALRALYNTYLVQYFDRPPLLLEVVSEAPYYIGNSEPEEFWSAIETDLLEAIPLLPDEVEPEWKGRVTKGAARAFLGKAYLFQEKWTEARQVFQDIIASNTYSLILPQGTDSLDYVYAYMCNFTYMDMVNPANVDDPYPSENNSESVFEIQNNNDERQWNQWLPGWGCNGTNVAAYFAPHGYRNAAPTENFGDNVFEKTGGTHPAGLEFDPRRAATIWAPGDSVVYNVGDDEIIGTPRFDPQVHANGAITQKYGLRKYYYPIHTGYLAPAIDPNNWRLIRYSDVLLMYAEADYHVSGSGGDGIQKLNEVRARAGMPDVADLTPEAIMHERDVEFGFECVRVTDLIRWSRVGPEWVAPEDLPILMPGFQLNKNEFWPIPINEINKMNGLLKQNPGW
jgi:starch-binding outer membrane protein, SusD/RagB family